MKKYYTRVCNFAYGQSSIELVRKKKNLPLNGNKKISFGQIEILTRTSIKIIDLKDIKKLPKPLRTKINKDLKIIVKKNKNFSSLNFNKIPNIMGVLNLTPDSFSDGGKFNKK
ncbi:MAG: dihydropteroate synthase, partial [Candidatus Pelagibacter ubique]